MVDIAARLKKLRVQKGLSQEALARELKVSSMTVSRWERGVFPPEGPTAIALAEFYGVTVDFILGREAPRETVLERDDEKPNPHFTAFLKLTNLDALGVTPEELEHVRRAPFRGGARSPLDYQRALLAILKIDELPQPEGLEAAKKRAKGQQRR